MEETVENVSVNSPRCAHDGVLEWHDEPHPADGTKHDLERVFRPLALEDARAWIKRRVFGDIGDLDIAQVEVGLDLLQGLKRVRLLAYAGRTMRVPPYGRDLRPERVGRPTHGRAPEDRDTQTQSGGINDLAKHKPGTKRTHRRSTVSDRCCGEDGKRSRQRERARDIVAETLARRPTTNAWLRKC